MSEMSEEESDQEIMGSARGSLESLEPIDQTTTSSVEEDETEEEDFDLDEQLKLKQKYFEALKNKGINPIFKQKQDIAQNINELLKKADDFNDSAFRDDTEGYVKSIGMKVIQDTNPELAETIDEATDFDDNANFNPDFAEDIRNNLEGFVGTIKSIQNAMKDPNKKMSGWNKMIEKYMTALSQLGFFNDKSKPFNINTKEKINEIDLDELKTWLKQRLNKIETKQNLTKGYRTDLQQQMNEYKDNTSFTTNKQVALDNKDEFYATAEPTLEAYKELISNYAQYLTPEVITELEKNVKEIEKYINDARLKGVSVGEMKEYTRLVNAVRKNVKDNYQNILNKMQAYSNSVSAEDAILNEIKSLASYEQYSQLPPAIFEKLPDEIKNKVMRLMELKAKLQKQQGKTKIISNKYKPTPSPNNKPKILNPMLNKGYSIHNTVAQHNAYNASFA